MKRARLVRTIVALLTAWALVTIAPDLRRPFDPLAAIGLTVDFAGRIVTVDPGGPAAAAGVHAATGVAPGDRIDFSHTPSATLFDLYGGLGGHAYLLPGHRITLNLIAPDGALRSVDLDPVQREPPFSERLLLFIAELLGIAFVAIAAFLAWNFPERRDVLGLFFYALWFNPGENYVFYSLLPQSLWLPQDVLSALLQATGLAGFITFSLRFPTDRTEGWRAPVQRALPLFVVVLTLLTIAGAGAEFGHPHHAIWIAALWIKLATYPLIVVALISKLRILTPAERLKLRTVIYGCIPGLLFYLLAESTEVTSLWQPLFDRIHWTPSEATLDAGYLVNALIPLSIGYAVMRRRVLPLNVIVNRGLTLGVIAVAIAMVFEAAVLSTHRVLEENHVLSTLILAIALVVIAPLVERVKAAVNALIDRFLFVRLYHGKRELDAAVEELAVTTSSETIEAAVVDRPCAAFDLAGAALFRLDEDGTFRLTSQHNWNPEAAQQFSADDALIRKLRDDVRETASIGVLRGHLDERAGDDQAELILTLAPNAYVDALVFFDGHSDGSAFTRDEAEVLTQFVRRCGALRAHLQAVAMRREIAGLREELRRLQSASI